MNKPKILLTFTILCLSISMLTGCTNPFTKSNDVPDNTTIEPQTSFKSGYSKDGKSYTIESNDVMNGNDKITINIPNNMTALEDTNENSNTYISLYNVGASGIATANDYVLTYKVITEDEITIDREDTENLYKNMYQDLVVSNIKEATYDNVPYKYYTIAYTSGTESLTDYVFQFNINETYVLTRVGTTFYPIDMPFEDILKLAFENIAIK